MQIETPDWLACLAYAYCFYKTANNAQPEQCLPDTGVPPPPTPLLSRLALLLLYKWNGSLAPLRNVPFSSSSASTLEGAPQSRLRNQHQHLWVNIQYSVELCVCVERSRWCKHRFITPIKIRIVIKLCDVCVIYLLLLLMCWQTQTRFNFSYKSIKFAVKHASWELTQCQQCSNITHTPSGPTRTRQRQRSHVDNLWLIRFVAKRSLRPSMEEAEVCVWGVGVGQLGRNSVSRSQSHLHIGSLVVQFAALLELKS